MAGTWTDRRMTVTGRTFAEEASEAKETPGQEVIRPLDNPIKTQRRTGDPARAISPRRAA